MWRRFKRNWLLCALGNAMVNLAMSYGDLGRHEDALVLEESVLEFFRRVLPEDHPYIGESRVHLQVSLCMNASLRA
jgi:hypothetical protein